MFKRNLLAASLVLSLVAVSCADKSEGFQVAGTPTDPQKQSEPSVPPSANGSQASPGSNGPVGPGSGAEPIPEPMTMLLFGTGLAGVAYSYRWRKRKKEKR